MSDDYSSALALKLSAPVLKERDSLFDEPDPEIWLALRDDFKSGDGLPVYFLSEIPVLGTKGEATLRCVNHVKKVFLGARVRI